MLKTVATLVFAILGAIVKFLSPRYPLGEITFCRSFFMLLPVFAVAAGGPGGLRSLVTDRPGSHARRAIAGGLGVLTTFATLRYLPFADATALTFSAPLFLTALAIPLLGERVGIYRSAAVVIGFMGVILIVQPHASHDNPANLFGVALGVLSGMCVALAQLAVRSLKDEPAVRTVVYFGAFLSLATLLTLPFGWRWPENWMDGGLLIATGLIGGVGQLLMTQSYRLADASMLAPYDYVQLIWALVIGYVVFDEMPVPLVFAGAALVAATGIFIALRERWLALQGRRLSDHKAPPPL